MTTTLTPFEEEKLREMRNEFYLHCADFTDENHHDIEPYQMQKIADWWIPKLADSLHQQREMIRKDLLEIAGQGEYEDLRREVENYFLLSNKEI